MLNPEPYYVTQVLEEQLERRGEAVAPLRQTLARALADVQERVTFRAHTFIRVRTRPYLCLVFSSLSGLGDSKVHPLKTTVMQCKNVAHQGQHQH